MSLSQTKKVPAKFLFRDKMNLKYYQKKILRLAKKKGFDQELFYLFGRMVQEGGEMLDAIWQGKSDEDVGEEFADIEHSGTYSKMSVKVYIPPQYSIFANFVLNGRLPPGSVR